MEGTGAVPPRKDYPGFGASSVAAAEEGEIDQVISYETIPVRTALRLKNGPGSLSS